MAVARPKPAHRGPPVRPTPAFDCSVRLSRIIAVGCALRPANSRSNMRRSSAMASKQRARIQRRQIVGHVAPLAAGAHHIAKAFEHRAQRIIPLLGLFFAQRQVRRDKCPFLIRPIAGVSAAFALPHAPGMNNNTTNTSSQ